MCFPSSVDTETEDVEEKMSQMTVSTKVSSLCYMNCGANVTFPPSLPPSVPPSLSLSLSLSLNAWMTLPLFHHHTK